MIPPPVTTPELARFIRDEFLRIAGLPPAGLRRAAARAGIWLPARRAAGLAAQFDADVAAYDLPEAAQRLLRRIAPAWTARGAERIPAHGPLLLCTNHPGAFDGFLVVASLPRSDVWAGVSENPFFRALRATAPHLIFIGPDKGQRIGAARAMARTLAEGHALVTYPAGLPEPDPALPGGVDAACAALERWSPSLELLLRHAPETQVVIALVCGVLAPECLRYPGVSRQPAQWQQQRLAEYLQVAQQVMLGRRFGLRPRVAFSHPFTAADLGDAGVLPGIIARARETLEEATLSSWVAPGSIYQ